MEIWGVLARSWGDYQPGATLARHESPGLMQNLPSLLLILGSVSIEFTLLAFSRL